MHALLLKLKGGDRRSIGASQQVVDQVLANPALFSVVFEGMSDADSIVRMRCADAVEKITVVHPAFLQPYAKQVFKLAEAAGEKEVKWHLAQLLSRLDLNRAERQHAVAIMQTYLADKSRIVKTFAMQALADIAIKDAELREPIVAQLRELTRTGSPAMQSRGRKLLARLDAGRQSDTRLPR
jgi:hypothetical protein